MNNQNKTIITGFNLDNSYLSLPKTFYKNIYSNNILSPNLVILSESLAKSLGLNIDFLKSEDGVDILCANKKITGGAYIAQAYAGHQFGSFTMLGDGRALLIGEQITPSKEKFDIQFKGSGRTPYSRGGDGKAVLGPMMREYIISEAMNGFLIPTTRSLSIVTTGENILRDNKIKQGAILTRVASSHIRFGTFQYAAYFLGEDKVKILADYTIKRHFPHIKDSSRKYIDFLDEVIKLQANLVASWQSVGFIHGVLNTDNMSICGETIDYGPCAFMDTYNPNTVFSSIDVHGRYSYKNQPSIVEWNLYRFTETLLSLIDANEDKSIEIANNSLSKFMDLYKSKYLSIMSSKLGIYDEDKDDIYIIDELLDIMYKYKLDYTNTFIDLTFDTVSEDVANKPEFISWNKKWQHRIEKQNKTKSEVTELMKKSNPALIPRNHRVEEAILAGENGDFSLMINLLDAVSNPYMHSDMQKKYANIPPASQCVYKTYCGT